MRHCARIEWARSFLGAEPRLNTNYLIIIITITETTLFWKQKPLLYCTASDFPDCWSKLCFLPCLGKPHPFQTWIHEEAKLVLMYPNRSWQNYSNYYKRPAFVLWCLIIDKVLLSQNENYRVIICTHTRAHTTRTGARTRWHTNTNGFHGFNNSSSWKPLVFVCMFCHSLSPTTHGSGGVEILVHFHASYLLRLFRFRPIKEEGLKLTLRNLSVVCQSCLDI